MTTIPENTLVITVGPGAARTFEEKFDTRELGFFEKTETQIGDQYECTIDLSQRMLDKPGAMRAFRKFHAAIDDYIRNNDNYEPDSQNDILLLRETLEALGVSGGDGFLYFELRVKGGQETSMKRVLTEGDIDHTSAGFSTSGEYAGEILLVSVTNTASEVTPFVQWIETAPQFQTGNEFDPVKAKEKLGIDVFNFYNVYCKHVMKGIVVAGSNPGIELDVLPNALPVPEPEDEQPQPNIGDVSFLPVADRWEAEGEIDLWILTAQVGSRIEILGADGFLLKTVTIESERQVVPLPLPEGTSGQYQITMRYEWQSESLKSVFTLPQRSEAAVIRNNVQRKILITSTEYRENHGRWVFKWNGDVPTGNLIFRNAFNDPLTGWTGTVTPLGGGIMGYMLNLDTAGGLRQQDVAADPNHSFFVYEQTGSGEQLVQEYHITFEVVEPEVEIQDLVVNIEADWTATAMNASILPLAWQGNVPQREIILKDRSTNRVFSNWTGKVENTDGGSGLQLFVDTHGVLKPKDVLDEAFLELDVYERVGLGEILVQSYDITFTRDEPYTISKTYELCNQSAFYSIDNLPLPKNVRVDDIEDIEDLTTPRIHYSENEIDGQLTLMPNQNSSRYPEKQFPRGPRQLKVTLTDGRWYIYDLNFVEDEVFIR